jgi:hypothetical protein
VALAALKAKATLAGRRPSGRGAYIQEVLEETLTMTLLGLPRRSPDAVCELSTNPIESTFLVSRDLMYKMKR